MFIDRLVLWWLIRRKLRKAGDRRTKVSVCKGRWIKELWTREAVIRLTCPSLAEWSLTVWWDCRKLHQCWCNSDDSLTVDNNRSQVADRVVTKSKVFRGCN